MLLSCSSKKGSKAKELSTPKYTADWESLQKYEVPEWYKDLKFGIYFHWGTIFCTGI
ncbi:hypothetical protein JCM19274_1300 [Algibacter lectus]|uniref:Glycoside hydrolase family 29 N-terminal domain-containing protein n=1 Tax=Algibacter lectus TaxID=221126 RepID=A0A090WZ11_9FLAO|nr:hypothetical protein JCM19274_1300 [Algibacter lectus]